MNKINQTFKKGSLIIKEGKMYFARLVGETETLFEEIEIFGFGESDTGISGYRTFGSLRSFIVSHIVEDCSTGKCAPRTFNEKSGRIESQQTEGKYPILGYINTTGMQGSGIYIDLLILIRYYPELAVRYTMCALDYAARKLGEKNKTVFTTPLGGKHYIVGDPSQFLPNPSNVEKFMRQPITEEDMISEKPVKKQPAKKPAKKAQPRKTARKR